MSLEPRPEAVKSAARVIQARQAEKPSPFAPGPSHLDAEAALRAEPLAALTTDQLRALLCMYAYVPPDYDYDDPTRDAALDILRAELQRREVVR